MMTIVGDGIENSGNVRTLLDAAEMFAAGCVFREHAHLAQAYLDAALDERQIRVVTPREIAGDFDPVLALDNVPGAASIYGFRPPLGLTPALIVGNERRGISHDLLTLADIAVEIPMPSRHLNCLNVASAAAVALYYLSQHGGKKERIAPHPEKRRPEILLLAPTDHVELGSSIRSAGAFGWQRIFVDDRHAVWFGIDRAARAEGRAAARRSRNPIHVIPSPSDRSYAFDEVCVVIPDRRGTPLSRAKLAGGQRQLVVIPDMQGVDVDTVDWERFGRRVEFATLHVPRRPAVRHYRLDASIALAEAARQVGRSSTPTRKRPSAASGYHRVLRTGPPHEGEIVYLDELERY